MVKIAAEKYDNKFYFHGQTVRKRNGWKLSERKEMIVNNILGVYLSSYCFFLQNIDVNEFSLSFKWMFYVFCGCLAQNSLIRKIKI